jgi:hypothetical protein
MISSLLNDILEDVVGNKDAIEEEVREEEAREEESSDEERDLSAYEKQRNKRVREIQAEFNSKFPNFEEEVRQLKVRKKRRNSGGRKTFPEVSTPRRSIRGAREASSGQQQIVSDAGVQDQSSSPQDQGLINDQDETVDDHPCFSDQPHGLGDKPGLPGDKPGLPGDQPGLRGDQPGLPGDQPGLPGDQPALPGDQPGLPGDQPGLPGDQPGLSGDQPGLSGECDLPGEQHGLCVLLGGQLSLSGDLVERDLPGDQHDLLGYQDQSNGIADHHIAEAEDEEARSAGNLELSLLGKYGCVPCGMKFRDRGNLKSHVKQWH